ncbi:MAG: hypothetical protein K8Q97_00260 [Candidatus Andersenbacteria bacterium]|nr:hypothetical protein [Candidatus Andersenbacteria bacterium]
MRKEFVVISFVGLLLAGIATASLYDHPNYISNHGDVNRGLIYNAIAKRDILSGHLPAWNQYVCGGMPLIGDLESWFLHPIFFLTIPFSEVLAMKIAYTLVLLSSFIGFYVFARIILKFKIAGAVLFAIILAFSGYVSAHLAEGYYVWVASAYVPWFLLFAMLALKNLKFIPLAGLMLAFMFGAGSMHLAVYSMLFMGIMYAFPIVKNKFFRRVAIWMAMGIFFIILSAAKLLPALSLLTAISSREGFAPALTMLPEILFGRGLLGPVISAGQTIRWGEFDAYIGVVAGVLTLFGAFMLRKKIWQEYRSFLVASIVMAIIAFLPLPITHGFISHIFDLFRMPSRVLLFSVFGIALVAGYTIDTISSSRIKIGIKSLIIFVITLDLVSNDATLFSRTFTVPLPEMHTETTFRRVSHAYTSGDEAYYRAVYIDYLENRGTNDVCRFYQMGPYSRAIDETDPRYISRGEVYADDANAGTISYSMNARSEYSIHANIQSATRVIINQNYYPGWTASSGGAVENYHGVIAIPVAVGIHDITLRYNPNTVYWGVVISLIGCLVGGMLWWPKKRQLN